MDGLFLTCLGLLMVCHVHSFTLQDYLRHKELTRLREQDTRDSSRYAKEDMLRDLERMREQNMHDSNRYSDEAILKELEQDNRDLDRASQTQKNMHEALNFLREIHARKLAREMDEECKDVNPDCVFLDDPEYECREEHRVKYMEEYCRMTCRYCIPSTQPKPPHPIQLPCRDEDEKACEAYKGLCPKGKSERITIVEKYMNKYCTKTCNVGECQYYK